MKITPITCVPPDEPADAEIDACGEDMTRELYAVCTEILRLCGGDMYGKTLLLWALCCAIVRLSTSTGIDREEAFGLLAATWRTIEEKDRELN